MIKILEMARKLFKNWTGTYPCKEIKEKEKDNDND